MLSKSKELCVIQTCRGSAVTLPDGQLAAQPAAPLVGTFEPQLPGDDGWTKLVFMLTLQTRAN